MVELGRKLSSLIQAEKNTEFQGTIQKGRGRGELGEGEKRSPLNEIQHGPTRSVRTSQWQSGSKIF